MISGPYAVCHVTFPEESDDATYRTLRFGFESAIAAQDALADVAAESGVAWQECAIVRHINTDEAEQFVS